MEENEFLTQRNPKTKFLELGATERSLNRYQALLKQNKSLGRKNGSGLVTKKPTPKVVRKIKRSFNHLNGISQRKAALKFSISQSYISKILKESSNIRVYKKIKKRI